MFKHIQNRLLSILRRGRFANHLLVKLAPLESIFAWRYTKLCIDRPIFIVGAPRSGTSVLYKSLMLHPELAYLTQASDLFPECPIVANSLFHITGLARLRPTSMALRGWSAHGFEFAEGFNVWRQFSSTQQDIVGAEDVTDEQRLFYRQIVQKHLFLFGRSRFINKSPHNSLRIGFLNEIYPDALFIHIHRDGRAVARSILEIRIKYGGPQYPFGPKPSQWAEIEKHEPLIASGLQWKYILQNIQYSFSSIPRDRHFTVGYFELAEYPERVLREILSFCGLSEVTAVTAAASRVHNMDFKWKTEIEPEQVRKLENAIGDALLEWGYI